MKKKIFLSFILSSLLFSGCSDSTQTNHVPAPQNSVEAALQTGIDGENSALETETETETETAAEEMNAVEDAMDNGEETVDLSEMNATMVYSEVFAMMTEPEKYIGKTIKMTGVCNRYTDIETGADYYACIITDATACCAQGIEFRLPEGEAYPQMGSEITVIGTFSSYFEGENEYYVLNDAKLL